METDGENIGKMNSGSPNLLNPGSPSALGSDDVTQEEGFPVPGPTTTNPLLPKGVKTESVDPRKLPAVADSAVPLQPAPNSVLLNPSCSTCQRFMEMHLLQGHATQAPANSPPVLGLPQQRNCNNDCHGGPTVIFQPMALLVPFPPPRLPVPNVQRPVALPFMSPGQSSGWTQQQAFNPLRNPQGLRPLVPTDRSAFKAFEKDPRPETVAAAGGRDSDVDNLSNVPMEQESDADEPRVSSLKSETNDAVVSDMDVCIGDPASGSNEDEQMVSAEQKAEEQSPVGTSSASPPVHEESEELNLCLSDVNSLKDVESSQKAIIDPASAISPAVSPDNESKVQESREDQIPSLDQIVIAEVDLHGPCHFSRFPVTYDGADIWIPNETRKIQDATPSTSNAVKPSTSKAAKHSSLEVPPSPAETRDSDSTTTGGSPCTESTGSSNIQPNPLLKIVTPEDAAAVIKAIEASWKITIMESIANGRRASLRTKKPQNFDEHYSARSASEGKNAKRAKPSSSLSKSTAGSRTSKNDRSRTRCRDSRADSSSSGDTADEIEMDIEIEYD